MFKQLKSGIFKCSDCKILWSNITTTKTAGTPLCLDCYFIRIGVVSSMNNTNQSSLLDFEGE